MNASIFFRELRKTFCILFNAAKISYANEEIDSFYTHLIPKAVVINITHIVTFVLSMNGPGRYLRIFC